MIEPKAIKSVVEVPKKLAVFDIANKNPLQTFQVNVALHDPPSTMYNGRSDWGKWFVGLCRKVCTLERVGHMKVGYFAATNIVSNLILRLG